MNYTFLIPVHLARLAAEGWREGDVIYDHPTPLDEPGTLANTLSSLKSLAGQEFKVVLLVSMVCPEIEAAAEAWVKEAIGRAEYRPKNLYIFSAAQLRRLEAALGEEDAERFKIFLSLGGYPQERNIGLICGCLLNSDAVIWLDDDEVVRDENFLKKISEGLGRQIDGEPVRLITGACPEGETGSYLRTREMKPWMKYWDKIMVQNETLALIFGSQPRWKKTPLAHGGLSVICREVFTKVPYDLYALRGEDMDYNLNTRMFGFTFFADNTLEIRHLPPPRFHPAWRNFRHDMLRFLWERNKIRNQRDLPGLERISAADFDPYPGYFLKDNLEEMIYKSQSALASEYLAAGKPADAEGARQNIFLSQNSPILQIDAFSNYLDSQRLWLELVKALAELPDKDLLSKIN